jgi:hypothetical protein
VHERQHENLNRQVKRSDTSTGGSHFLADPPMSVSPPSVLGLPFGAGLSFNGIRGNEAMTEEQLRNWIAEQYTQMLPELLSDGAERERMSYLIEQAYEQRRARDV